MVAVRQRDAGVAGHTAGRGDARHHLERRCRGGQRLHLLAAAAEDERVAALEAHHLLAFARQSHQQRVDFLLRHAVVVALLADVDALGVGGRSGQHLGRHQVVVDDDVGLREQSRGAQRQQFGVARAGADQVTPCRRRGGAIMAGRSTTAFMLVLLDCRGPALRPPQRLQPPLPQPPALAGAAPRQRAAGCGMTKMKSNRAGLEFDEIEHGSVAAAAGWAARSAPSRPRTPAALSSFARASSKPMP